MKALKDLEKQANEAYLRAMSCKTPKERQRLLKEYKQAKCRYYRHKVWLQRLSA